MSGKTCGKCGQAFPATDEYFYRRSSVKPGLQSYCKSCAHRATAESMAKHRAAANEYQRQLRANHPDTARERERRYYAAHAAEINARRKARRARVQVERNGGDA